MLFVYGSWCDSPIEIIRVINPDLLVNKVDAALVPLISGLLSCPVELTESLQKDCRAYSGIPFLRHGNGEPALLAGSLTFWFVGCKDG